MAAPAAPAAGVAGAAIVALTQLLGWCIAFGLLFFWNHTGHLLIEGLANRIAGIGISGRFRPDINLKGVANALRAMDAAVREALASWIRGAEISIAYLWDQIAVNTDHMADWMVNYANTMEGVVNRINKHAIPRAEDAAVARAKQGQAATAGAVKEITTVALPGIRAGEIALGGRVGTLEDIYQGLRAKVRQHERLLLGAGAAALGIRILSRLKIGWLRCTKVGRMGRATCGMDADFLTSVLALSTVMFGTYSLVQFAEEMQDVTEEVAPLIQRFWRAT